eukprot:scaffold6021_cov117-Isochrysis_galbana.AAC.19
MLLSIDWRLLTAFWIRLAASIDLLDCDSRTDVRAHQDQAGQTTGSFDVLFSALHCLPTPRRRSRRGAMCSRGVWQMRKLLIKYCDYGGSSAGVRDWIQTQLIPFGKANPHLEIIASRSPGRHPHVQARYLADGDKSLSLKNLSYKQVSMRIQFLRDARPVRLSKWDKPFRTTPSVQGEWKLGQQLGNEHRVIRVGAN